MSSLTLPFSSLPFIFSPLPIISLSSKRVGYLPSSVVKQFTRSTSRTTISEGHTSFVPLSDTSSLLPIMNSNTVLSTNNTVSSWDSKRIKGIVFDMDGTLTCAGAIDFEAIRTRCGVPPGHDILAYIESLPDKEEQIRCSQILEEEETLGLQRMMLADGAYQLLDYIRNRSIPQALLTRNNDHAMYQTMKLLKGTEFFSPMLSRSFTPCKPHPAPLLHIAQQWGLASNHLLMVGDSIDDMMCGKQAGAQTCLIYTNKNCLIYQKALPYADITISSLTELQQLLP